MKTISDVSYVTTADLATRWNVARVTLTQIIYRSLASEEKGFPAPDIDNGTRRYWREDRVPELDAWWKDRVAEDMPEQVRRYIDSTSGQWSESVIDSEPKVVFPNTDIHLKLAEGFPQFQETHILAIVRRNNTGSNEHYFITGEQAEYILNLFR